MYVIMVKGSYKQRIETLIVPERKKAVLVNMLVPCSFDLNRYYIFYESTDNNCLASDLKGTDFGEKVDFIFVTTEFQKEVIMIPKGYSNS